MTLSQHHYMKEVRKAAKKSKTFEMQRLVKRLKDLKCVCLGIGRDSKPSRLCSRSKPTHVGTALEDAKDLETQLESLKVRVLSYETLLFILSFQRTDHERIAHLALSSKIRKDKILTSNNAIIAFLASPMFTTTDANNEARHVKVESRLLSSKILAAEAQEAVKRLRAVLEPGRTTKAQINVTTMEAENNDQERDEEIDTKVVVDARLGLKSADDDRSNKGDMQKAMLGEVLDEADDMVDDDGWESGSIDNIEHAASDDEESNSPRQQTRQRLGSLDPSSSAAASTFLPSLSVGYIKGDSDSDIDMSDGETAANGRKNRRGQRARQASVHIGLYRLGICI